MAIVSLQYDPLDESAELAPELDLSGLIRQGKDYPFHPDTNTGLLFADEPLEAGVNSPEYKESVRQMVGNLYMTLLWFRRLKMTADDFARHVKDYPNTNLGKRHNLMNNSTIRDAMDDGKDLQVVVPSNLEAI